MSRGVGEKERDIVIKRGKLFFSNVWVFGFFSFSICFWLFLL